MKRNVRKVVWSIGNKQRKKSGYRWDRLPKNLSTFVSRDCLGGGAMEWEAKISHVVYTRIALATSQMQSHKENRHSEEAEKR